jgi:hypothetical protein
LNHSLVSVVVGTRAAEAEAKRIKVATQCNSQLRNQHPHTVPVYRDRNEKRSRAGVGSARPAV